MFKSLTKILGVRQSSVRDVKLDIMKGIGIILVVYGHTYSNSSFLYLFHMPLFFILSGAAMSYSAHGYSVYRRFKAIMIPYFVFSVLCFCYWILIESKLRPIHEEALFMGHIGYFPIKIQQFINIFLAENCTNSFEYNVVLWFLPCLFVADFICAGINKIKFQWLAVILAVTSYYLLIDKLPCLPFCLNIAILAVPLIWLGKIGYKFIIKHFNNHCLVCPVLSMALFVILYEMFSCLGIRSNMLANKIPPFYSFYSASIVGSMGVILMSLAISRITIRGGQILAFLGKNSLVVMCIHEPIKRILLVLCSKISQLPVDILRSDLILSAGCTLVIALTCVPFIYMINSKYLKWMLGKF